MTGEEAAQVMASAGKEVSRSPQQGIDLWLHIGNPKSLSMCMLNASICVVHILCGTFAF